MALAAPQPDSALQDLLEHARGGDRDALRQVAERHWPLMRRWAWWELGDRDKAEDAVQDALVRLVRSFGTWDPARAPFVRWLRALVRNACRDLRVRQDRHGVTEHPDRERLVPSTLERRVDLGRAAKRALAAVEALAPRQRELLLRVDRGGEAPTEVARDLGLSPGAVRNQLYTARHTLRARLLADGGEVLALLREE